MNRAAYVVLLTADPSQRSQPVGRELLENAATVPISSPSGCAEPFIYGCFARINERLHGQCRRLDSSGIAIDSTGI